MICVKNLTNLASVFVLETGQQSDLPCLSFRYTKQVSLTLPQFSLHETGLTYLDSVFVLETGLTYLASVFVT